MLGCYVYGEGEETKEHNHWPYLWSWCYYVKAPEGSSPLVFPETKPVICFEPEEGDLIIFSSLAMTQCATLHLQGETNYDCWKHWCQTNMSGATYYKFNMELPMLWVNLKEFDNDKLADIIISKGDVQNKETNVKANMTGWRLDLEHEEGEHSLQTKS